MAEKHLVHIENSGEDYLCAPDQNLLRGMEVLGRRGIPVGCRGGGCGVCKIEILGGEFQTKVMSSDHVKMSKSCVSDEELAQGIVLACRAFPRGEVSLTVVGKMVKTVCAGAPCGSD